MLTEKCKMSHKVLLRDFKDLRFQPHCMTLAYFCTSFPGDRMNYRIRTTLYCNHSRFDSGKERLKS